MRHYISQHADMSDSVARHRSQELDRQQDVPPLKHDVTKRTASKPFDVAKWLDKIVRVSCDYLQILEVVLVPIPNAPEAPTISTSDIRSTLHEVGWTVIEDAQYHTLVEDLRRNLDRFDATDVSAAASSAGLGASVRAWTTSRTPLTLC